MKDVLIADDSRLQRGMIRQAVKHLQCTVREVENGCAALDEIDARRPDCLVLDLMMPEMGGFAVMQALRQRNLVLPIIVATSDMHDQTRRACLDAGALEVIYKPLNEKEIRGAVEKVLGLTQSPARDSKTSL